MQDLQTNAKFTCQADGRDDGWMDGTEKTYICTKLDFVNPDDDKRVYTSVWDNNRIGTGHAQSQIDSVQAWSAQHNAVGQYIQMDNGRTQAITGVITQGRHGMSQWVTKYKVKYSVDGASWLDVDGGATFDGNSDCDTKARGVFNKAVQARYVRIYPQTWYSHMSMRCGLLVKSSSTR